MTARNPQRVAYQMDLQRGGYSATILYVVNTYKMGRCETDGWKERQGGKRKEAEET